MSHARSEKYFVEAADRSAIADTIARYALWGDYGHDKKRQWAELFAEDGVWGMPLIDAYFNGRDEIEKVIDIVLGCGLAIHHSQSNHVIDLDGDRARGSVELNAFMLNGGQVHNTLHAVYDDEYVRVGDRWLFKSRLVRITEEGIQILTDTFGKQFGKMNASWAEWLTQKAAPGS